MQHSYKTPLLSLFKVLIIFFSLGMDAIETEVLEEASSAIEKDSESTVDSVTTTSAQHVINLLLQSQAVSWNEIDPDQHKLVIKKLALLYH